MTNVRCHMRHLCQKWQTSRGWTGPSSDQTGTWFYFYISLLRMRVCQQGGTNMPLEQHGNGHDDTSEVALFMNDGQQSRSWGTVWDTRWSWGTRGHRSHILPESGLEKYGPSQRSRCWSPAGCPPITLSTFSFRVSNSLSVDPTLPQFSHFQYSNFTLGILKKLQYQLDILPPAAYSSTAYSSTSPSMGAKLSSQVVSGDIDNVNWEQQLWTY